MHEIYGCDTSDVTLVLLHRRHKDTFFSEVKLMLNCVDILKLCHVFQWISQCSIISQLLASINWINKEHGLVQDIKHQNMDSLSLGKDVKMIQS